PNSGDWGTKHAVSTGWAWTASGRRDRRPGTANVSSANDLTRDRRPEPHARGNYEIQPDQRGTFEIIRLAVEDDHRTQNRRQAERGDKERRRDERENGPAKHHADEHQHRDEKQRNLKAAVQDQAHGEVGLIARRRRYADDVLHRIACDRHDNQTDELLRKAEARHGRCQGGDEPVGNQSGADTRYSKYRDRSTQ